MADHDYKTGGWKNKYIIFKNDIIGEIGGVVEYHDDGTKTNKVVLPIYKPVDPGAIYFVLRLDEDPHARKAALAYAASVEKENPELALDIRKKLETIKKS